MVRSHASEHSLHADGCRRVLTEQLAKTVASVPPSRPIALKLRFAYQVLTEQFAIAGGVCATKPLLKYG